MSDTFSQDDLDDLIAFYKRRTGITVIHKRDAVLAKFVEEGLIALHGYADIVLSPLGRRLPVMTPEEWMTGSATTVAQVVWLPEEWTIDQKVLVMPHEVQHALQNKERQVQSDLPPGVRMMWLYLTFGEGRVRLEAESERAGMESYKLVYGTVPPFEEWVKSYDGTMYLFFTEEKRLMHELLAAAIESVNDGLVSTASGELFHEWYQERFG